MTRILSVLILSVMLPGQAFGITMSPGQPLDFSFDGLTPTDPPGGPFVLRDIAVFWGPSLTGPGVATLDLFEDRSDDVPFFTAMFDQHWAAGFTIDIDAWNDLDGRIVLSVSEGVHEIDFLIFGARSDGEFYGRSYDLTAVPLPPAIVLFVSGLLVVRRRLS